MKRYSLTALIIALTLSCSKDTVSSSTSDVEDPRMVASAMTNVFGSGLVSEQTAEEAKTTIFGRWEFSSSSNSSRSSNITDCSFDSIEFTDDSFLINISDPNTTIHSIHGDYTFEEENDKVTKVILNSYSGGELYSIAEMTNIEVVETDGVFDISFTFSFLEDLSIFSIPCSGDLSEDYSAEKDEPMDGTLDADINSNHYKAVGLFLASAYTDSDGWDLNMVYQEPCIDYSYDHTTGEETETINEDCTPLDSIQLELSTFGTYLFMQFSDNSPYYIEAGKWAWTNDEQTEIIVTTPSGETFDVVLTQITDSSFIMNIEELDDDGELYSAAYTWSKQ